jgi:integrase
VGRDSTSLGRLVQTLAAVEKEEKEKSGQAGAAEASGKIVEFLWWLKKQGYAESTIKSRVKLLKRLVKLGANLFDPDSVKEVIAKQDTWNPGRKELAVEAYSSFLTMLGGAWNPPRYKRIPKLPFIPLESEIDQLIACFGSKMAALLQLLKETGIRLGEAVRIKWQDIDFQSGVIRITPEKGSNPRVLKLSGKLLQMLNNIRRNAETENVFPSKSCIEAYYYRKRKQIAAKLCNPRLLQISFHTFRHWKATMEYAKTKDILHVMKILGHKSIQNTLVYTQLIDFKSDEYVCKTAENAREAAKLVEGGFEYVCTTPEGIMLFRKRK